MISFKIQHKINMTLKKQQRMHSYTATKHSFDNISFVPQMNRKEIGKPSINEEKSMLSEITYLINLQLLGIGYRAYVVKPKTKNNNYYDKFLVLKVGQSGDTVYPIPNDVKINCPVDAKADKEPIILTSQNLSSLKKAVAEIKSYRKLDVYKGSGILECERLQTAEGEQFITETILRKEIKKKK